MGFIVRSNYLHYMKKIFSFVIVLFITLFFSGCEKIKDSDLASSSVYNLGNNYTGSYYKGNYVWGGAMNLAWNELNDNILHEKLALDTTDKTALDLVSKLNNSMFTKNDLDEESYYIKSGFGQETVNIINKESKIKFPKKSFSDINLILEPTYFISYAYFLKEIEYKTKFTEYAMDFNGYGVSGFLAYTNDQKENINIIKYENSDKFIIGINLKNDKDQLFLVKGFGFSNIEDIMNNINSKTDIEKLKSKDVFRAPKLKLNYNRQYSELENQLLKNEYYKRYPNKYRLGPVFENIKFDMDEKGVKIENEAIISGYDLIAGGDAPRYFILDKPYLVIMKRASSKNPYFILEINNAELMERNKDENI